jgi:hypothetical protein
MKKGKNKCRNAGLTTHGERKRPEAQAVSQRHGRVFLKTAPLRALPAKGQNGRSPKNKETS